MHCTKRITDTLTWVGANDRRLAMFEGVYAVPYGVSYNAYLFQGEETVLFDTVDQAVTGQFFENLTYALGGRSLDYLVIHHMEPDHSAALEELILRYPKVKILCSAKIQKMIQQFFAGEIPVQLVNEGDCLNLGGHEFTFVMAPMVHWPEVMMTYDKTDKILFSADAFGHFGAINGAMFADEVDFEGDYLSEARRYYTNIVGKYGPQVQAALKKAAGLELAYVCPLHGFVWRKGFERFLAKYDLWSRYEPEEQGVLIAYASVYHNTENAAEILSSKLRDRGIKTAMYDVSVTPASEIVSEAFRYSHLVLASLTYNAGIFVQMDAFLSDLVAHNIQNRVVGIIENGSWAPTSGKLMKEMLSKCKEIQFLETSLSLKSSLKENQLAEIDQMVEEIVATMPEEMTSPVLSDPQGMVDSKALFSLSYGLFVLTAKGEQQNGCIINTAMQTTVNPEKLVIGVNKRNYTHDLIVKTGEFNLSVLTEDTPFSIFERFGFQSGRETDKFAEFDKVATADNGIYYLTQTVNAMISGKVLEQIDCGSHTLFVAQVTQAKQLSRRPSATYEYYFQQIKPKVKESPKKGKRWVCKICGYVYDEEVEKVPFEQLPEDWVCPLCKHPKSDFELK